MVVLKADELSTVAALDVNSSYDFTIAATHEEDSKTVAQLSRWAIQYMRKYLEPGKGLGARGQGVSSFQINLGEWKPNGLGWTVNSGMNKRINNAFIKAREGPYNEI